MSTALDVGRRLTQRGLLHHGDTLARVQDTLARLPKSWQGIQTRADIFAALEAAYIERDSQTRWQTWERIRYLHGFPEVPGIQQPLYSVLRGAHSRPMESSDEPPTFDALMAALNRAAGWAA